MELVKNAVGLWEKNSTMRIVSWLWEYFAFPREATLKEKCMRMEETSLIYVFSDYDFNASE